MSTDSGVIVLPNPPDQPGSGGGTEHTYELHVQRELTEWFINTMPVFIALTPRQRVRSSSGGYSWQDQPPRETQTLRLCEPPDPGLQVQGSDGKLRDVQWLLVARWDAVLGRYDAFELDGRQWEVSDLMPYNGWERRAAVTARG